VKLFNDINAKILSKDSVTVKVDAVVYYRVFNPIISVVNVVSAHQSTRLLAQTTLRNVLGTKSLSEMLSDRENISQFMQVRWRCASLKVCRRRYQSRRSPKPKLHYENKKYVLWNAGICPITEIL